MINFNEVIGEQVVARCKKLRIDYGTPQGFYLDKSTISKFENQKDFSKSFISPTILDMYSDSYILPKQEIIFGDERNIERLLDRWFFYFIDIASLRDLDDEKNRDLYKEESYNDLDALAQKSAISLCNAFAEYNMKRYNFLKTEDTCMDELCKGLSTATAKVAHPKPMNAETIVDIMDIFRKMWLICKNKTISSFKNNVINSMFSEDVFHSSQTNQKIYAWIRTQFIGDIIPSVVHKLKENSVFKIGYMVNDLINNFLQEDLPKSFQETVPLQTTNDYLMEIDIKNSSSLSESMLLEKSEIINNIINGKTTNFSPHEIQKYHQYGINITQQLEETVTDKVAIDDIIKQIVWNSKMDKVLSSFNPLFEFREEIEIADLESADERQKYLKAYLSRKDFTNSNIPAYFSKNSQIIDRIQELLNEEIKDTITDLIFLQNNLLKLVTNEELTKFAE